MHLFSWLPQATDDRTDFSVFLWNQEWFTDILKNPHLKSHEIYVKMSISNKPQISSALSSICSMHWTSNCIIQRLTHKLELCAAALLSYSYIFHYYSLMAIAILPNVSRLAWTQDASFRIQVPCLILGSLLYTAQRIRFYNQAESPAIELN